MIGADAVASRLVDNRDLGALYAAAGLVLNDHWEDMRLTGFVSNRLMDAAASGARVASDEIPGLDLAVLFGGLVQTWSDQHDLARIVRERDSLFPSGDDRVRAAERVAAEHSFDARAAVLLDHAVRLVRP
jgi:spore maturation protein CgeB